MSSKHDRESIIGQVLKRPGMYFGSVKTSGLLSICDGLVNHTALDWTNNLATKVEVVFSKNAITITDDSTSFSFNASNPDSGLRKALYGFAFYDNGKWKPYNPGYKTDTQEGIGSDRFLYLAFFSIPCSYFSIETRVKDTIYSIETRFGRIVATTTRPAKKQWFTNRIVYRPDKTFWKVDDTNWYQSHLQLLQDYATAFPGLRVSATDKIHDRRRDFFYPYGCLDRLKEEIRCSLYTPNFYHVSIQEQNLRADIALCNKAEIGNSLFNMNRTYGGCHINGIKDGIANLRRAPYKQILHTLQSFIPEFESWSYWINVNTSRDFQWAGATREIPNSPAIQKLIGDTVTAQLFSQLLIQTDGIKSWGDIGYNIDVEMMDIPLRYLLARVCERVIKGATCQFPSSASISLNLSTSVGKSKRGKTCYEIAVQDSPIVDMAPDVNCKINIGSDLENCPNSREEYLRFLEILKAALLECIQAAPTRNDDKLKASLLKNLMGLRRNMVKVPDMLMKHAKRV